MSLDPGSSTHLTHRPGRALEHRARPAEHLVRFYESDDALADVAAEFIASGLQAGETVVAIVTPEHRAAFAGRLTRSGVDVAALTGNGRLVFADAHQTLERLMVGELPDASRFEDVVGGLLGQGPARVRAYGEMVDLLWKAGHRPAAIRLEELWNALQRKRSFTLLCAYAMGGFYREPAALEQVCAAHSQVQAAEPAAADPRTALEQARLLTAEIARRKEVEAALRAALAELRDTQEELDDFVENANVGLHRVGPDGTILWANRAELDLLGYRYEEYVGQPVWKFHADRAVIDDVLARLHRHEDVHSVDARLIARDGSIKQVLLSSNVLWRDGQFVHTRCFTRDVTARREAERALRDADHELRAVTDAIPGVLNYVDASERYQLVNATWEKWHATPRAQVLGRTIREVVGEATYAAARPYMLKALAGRRVHFVMPMRFADGSERWVEADYVPRLSADGKVVGFVSLVTDVSERVRLEQFHAAAAERSQRLLKITAAIADAVSSAQVIEAVVDRLTSAVDALSGALWLMNDDGKSARLVRSVGYGLNARRSLAEIRLDSQERLPVLDALSTRKPIWLASREEMLDRYPHLTALSVDPSYRVSCLPLMVHDRVVGVLGLTFPDAGEPSAEDKSFLLVVARYAAQTVERLRLYEAEKHNRAEANASAERLGVLSRASRALVEASQDLSQVLQTTVDEVVKEYAQGASVNLISTDGQQLFLAAVQYVDPKGREIYRAIANNVPVKLGEGPLGEVAHSGKASRQAKIDHAALLGLIPPEHQSALAPYLPGSMVILPLAARGKMLGVLTATRTDASPPFSDRDQEVLEELARRAAMAIENTRLYHENAEGRARAEQLYRFAQATVTAQQLEGVYEAALDAIGQALGARRASILTFDADGVMRFKAWRGLSQTYRAAVEGHSPWTRESLDPQPILISDAMADPAMAPYRAVFAAEGIGSLAFIPLVAAGKLLGKFMVYYDEPRRFFEHDVELAQAIAHHLASVTERFAAIRRLHDIIHYHEVFAGILAHDLRNPLGAILTTAQLLLRRQEGEGDKVTKPLGRILVSGERMTRMIEQLLDFTRARVGGGIALVPRATDLAELCAQAATEVELAHPEWSIVREAYGALDGTWDPDRILQVLSNLLANACQHGTPGEPVRVTLDGTAREQVVLTVANGGAIDPALIPNLFDPFRGTRYRQDQSRGLGLGLFITKEIVNAHAGGVEVRTSPGEGTRFVVTLPRG